MNTQQQKAEIAAARVETSVLAGRKISRLVSWPISRYRASITSSRSVRLREDLAVAGTATAPW